MTDQYYSVDMYDVVIRCKNEAKDLEDVLISINSQTIKPNKIVIVDNYSTDNSVTIAEKYNCKIVHYDLELFNYSRALNLGLTACDAAHVLILSAHCPLTNSDSLEIMLNELENERVAGVFGRQLPTSSSTPFDVRDLLTVFGRERIVYDKFPFFHNAFSVIRRQSWEEVNFNESYNGIEDRLWAREQCLRNKRIVYCPDAKVFHEHGLNHAKDFKRAVRVCQNLSKLHLEDDIDFPDFV